MLTAIPRISDPTKLPPPFLQPDGGLVIRSLIGPSVERQHHEREMLLPGVKVGLPGWHRAHSQGAGTGFEAREGIRYAPAELNLQYQTRVENMMRMLYETAQKDPAKPALVQTTVTYGQPGKPRVLKSIEYVVHAVKGGNSTALVEVYIGVEDKLTNPRIEIGVTPRALTAL